jgi:hypothetical protein
MDSQRRSLSKRAAAIAAALSLVCTTVIADQHENKYKHKRKRGPETFSASARIQTAAFLATAYIRIHLDAYTPARDQRTMIDALRTGGYDAFLIALRQAPAVGYVEIRDERWTVRWASQQPTLAGRRIVVATDQPVTFVGAGAPGIGDAKPRDRYGLALVELQMDDIGMGEGTMTAAARIAPGVDGQGIRVDQYADQPIQLKSVIKVIP